VLKTVVGMGDDHGLFKKIKPKEYFELYRLVPQTPPLKALCSKPSKLRNLTFMKIESKKLIEVK
jgi:hypothetical protein